MAQNISDKTFAAGAKHSKYYQKSPSLPTTQKQSKETPGTPQNNSISTDEALTLPTLYRKIINLLILHILLPITINY